MSSCLIISGGDFSPFTIPAGVFVIACDRGYAYAKSCGVRPDLVVGDFDSYSGELDPDIPMRKLPVEKDDTDTMLAIKHGLGMGMTEFVLLGCLGGRLDHTAANISALQYIRNHGAAGMLADESTVLRVFGQGDEIKPVMSGRENYFSVFPFGCEYAVVSAEGVMYPMHYQRLHSAFPLGVSNHVTDPGNFSMTVHEGTALIIECQEKR